MFSKEDLKAIEAAVGHKCRAKVEEQEYGTALCVVAEDPSTGMLLYWQHIVGRHEAETSNVFHGDLVLAYAHRAKVAIDEAIKKMGEHVETGGETDDPKI